MNSFAIKGKKTVRDGFAQLQVEEIRKFRVKPNPINRAAEFQFFHSRTENGMVAIASKKQRPVKDRRNGGVHENLLSP
jgi:hypothetical protein